MLPELLCCVSGLSKVLAREFLQSHFAVKRHKDVGHQRYESVVCTNIGGRLLAADVLFARSKGENNSPFAIAVGRLPAETSGNLAPELLARGNYAAVGASEAEGNAE